MTISRVARQFLYAAALGAALAGFASDLPAFAQSFFGYGGPSGGYPGYGPSPGYGPPRSYDDRDGRFGGPPGRRAFAVRRIVAGLLAERGLRLEGPLDFEGPNIVAIGVDPAGHARRFVVDPYQGEVLSARPLPQTAARPDRPGDTVSREDLPPPPRAAAAGPRGAAQPTDPAPVWRAQPASGKPAAPDAKIHPAALEHHDAAPAPEKHKPLPTPAAVQASAAPMRAIAAPARHEAPAAAPTGELEPPQPGG